jgi:hypothetical protein
VKSKKILYPCSNFSNLWSVINSRFETTNGYNNGTYVALVKLKFHIPEFLPMWGKKVRIYYHGIPFFCVTCYEVGHNRNTCPNSLISWKDYINFLIGTGISTELFGSWLESNISVTRENQSNVPQPFFEIDRAETEADPENEEIDFNSLPQNVVNLLRKLSSSTPISGKKAPLPISDSKLKAKNRQQNYFRGRGRGRGNSNPNQTQSQNFNQNASFRGRGRGVDPFSSSRGRGGYDPNTSFRGARGGRGRGRG